MSQQYQKMKKKQYEKGFQEGKQQALKQFEELIDKYSIPMMNEEELDKFINENDEDKFRILDWNKFKQQLEEIK